MEIYIFKIEASIYKKSLTLLLKKEKMRSSNDTRVVKVRDSFENFHNIYRTKHAIFR